MGGLCVQRSEGARKEEKIGGEVWNVPSRNQKLWAVKLLIANGWGIEHRFGMFDLVSDWREGGG